MTETLLGAQLVCEHACNGVGIVRALTAKWELRAGGCGMCHQNWWVCDWWM